VGVFTGSLPTILAGYVPSGDDWVNILAELTALQASWTDFSSSVVLTNMTLGNGTQVARYRQIGKSVDWYWQFLLGSTSTVGTSPTFTLPVTPAATYPVTNPQFPGGVHLLQTGVTERQGLLKLTSGSTVMVDFWNATPAAAILTATTPWTWATGHYMTAWGTYEAA
jgi:hypothetical protein